MSQYSPTFTKVQNLVNRYFGEFIEEFTFRITRQGNVPLWRLREDSKGKINSNLEELTKDLEELDLIPLIKEAPKSKMLGSSRPTNQSQRMLYGTTDLKYSVIDEDQDNYWLIIVPFKKKTTSPSNTYLPIALFIATFLSVLFVGLTNAMNIADTIIEIIDKNEALIQLGINTNFSMATLPFFYEPIVSGMLYTIGLLAIVGIHELGHMAASKHHNVDASLPYFIPMPFNGLGTFGAVISQREPMRSKNAMFDIGIAGPIAGLVIAFIATIIGLVLSIPVPVILIDESIGTNTGLGFTFILFEILKGLLFINAEGGTAILVHPLAFAGWIGMLITSINLMPLGQLDGGHVFRSFLNENQHKIVSYAVAFLLIITTPELSLMVLILLALYSQTGHPGAQNDITPITMKRRLFVAIIIILVILTFPVPTALF